MCEEKIKYNGDSSEIIIISSLRIEIRKVHGGNFFFLHYPIISIFGSNRNNNDSSFEKMKNFLFESTSY